MTSLPSLSPGTAFIAGRRRYRVGNLIGRGGEGEAYMADDSDGNAHVLKVYLPGDVADHARLRAHVAWLAGLELWRDSPVLAGAPRSAVEVGGRPGYLAAYVPGMALHEFGRAHAGDLGGGLRAMAALAAGVHVLERRRFVHSDISPTNARVDRGSDGVERVALIDFDGGRVSGLPASVSIIGSPGAIAPELFLPNTVTTIESDRFALAAAIHVSVLFRSAAAELSENASVQTQYDLAARNRWVEEDDVKLGGAPTKILSAALRRGLRRGLAVEPCVRTSAGEWYQLLLDAAKNVYACGACGFEHVNDPERVHCAVCGAAPMVRLALSDGRTVELRAPVAVVGRDLLRDPRVSHEHLVVTWNGFEPVVVDRGSRHGSEMWDGLAWRPIPPQQPLALRVGDELRLAGVVRARVS